MSGMQRPGGRDPFAELSREVSRLVDALDPRPSRRSLRVFPPVNLYDAGDRFLVAAELPGHVADEIELTLAGDLLTLSGERRRGVDFREERYRRRERSFVRWSRSIALPGRVEGTGVSASYAQGILTVVLPKARDEGPRQVAVRAGKP
jgi:HSP20 family protein